MAAISYSVSEFGFKQIRVDDFGFSPRPYVLYVESIQPIGEQYQDTSFPSTHMVVTVSLLLVFLYFVPALWPYALVFAFLMAFSRMHNGMHYPTDIWVGSLLGLLSGFLGYHIAKGIFGPRTTAF